MSDEYECPSCGKELQRDEDPHGIVYQCHAMDCMEMYEEDEIAQGNEPQRTPPMARYATPKELGIKPLPPLNTYIEWDGSETPPVPVGTKCTLWHDWVESGIQPLTIEVSDDSPGQWAYAMGYLVHAYPPEPTVKDYYIFITENGTWGGFSGGIDCPSGRVSAIVSRVHLRFTNGVAEIVSQEKA